jgi:hypothetical protein
VLVVREEGRALVEAFLCDMASGDDRDGDKAGWDEQDEGSEEVESAMGELFVGADHLVRAPWDAGTLGLVRSLGGLVERSMPPFGIEPRGWREIATRAAAIVVAGDLGDLDGAEDRARHLRMFLRVYVGWRG